MAISVKFNVINLILFVQTLSNGCLGIFLNCGQCQRGRSLTCPDVDNMQFEVSVNEDFSNSAKYMEVKCNSVPTIDYSLLSDCNFNFINHLKFDYCPLKNESLYISLQKLGLKADNITYLSIYFPHNEVRYLSEDYLDGFFNLITFKLDNSDLEFINENVFTPVMNLKTLYLTGHKFTSLPDKVFQPMVNLKVLNIGVNKLSTLSDKLFRGLRNLQALYLYRNQLKELREMLFSDLVSLQNLSIYSNQLEYLDADLFVNNSKLYFVNLDNNNLASIPNELFKYNLDLTKVKLDRNNISKLSSDIFLNNINLSELTLSLNAIQNLNEDFFLDLSNLKSLFLSRNYLLGFSVNISVGDKLENLDLSHNYLTDISNKLFSRSKSLKILNLGYNNISKLSDRIFVNCISLEILSLNNNTLSALSPSSSFPQVSSLKEINLSFNFLNETNVFDYGIVFALNSQLKLEKIDFSYNNFSEFPKEANMINFRHLKKLSFRGNRLRVIEFSDLNLLKHNIEIDFRDNQIESVVAFSKSVDKRIYLYMSGNNFSCDCKLYSFVRSIQNDQSYLLKYMYKYQFYERDEAQQLKDSEKYLFHIIDAKDLLCKRPDYVKNKTLKTLNTFDMHCEWGSGKCSTICPCIFRPADSMVSVKCVNLELEKLPEILYYKKNHNYLLDFTNSSLNFKLLNFTNLPYITNLSLNNIGLTKNDLNQPIIFPKSLKYLDLRKNNFTSINKGFLDNLVHKKIHVYLSENPYHCDCEIVPMHNFMKSKYVLVKDLRKISCFNFENEPLLLELQEDDICPFYLQRGTLAGMILFPIFLIIVAILVTILLYKYKTSIKIWLYTNKYCLCLITEEELDSDKQYDAFISYSHKDEEFVNDTILPELENGDPKYKVCLHYRDWVVGELIPNQIMNSVHDSRRTIVILSSNFLESIWGKMEFRAAHKQALQDKTNRVILIVYGEMPPLASLDEELRHYISLHTYLKWGAPKFWESLRYAMPHPQDQAFLFKKKKIDKMELVKGVPKIER